MKIRHCGYAFALVCLLAPPAMAQQWLSGLPQSVREEPSINDLREAFARFYLEHPVDLKLDKLAPTFRFEGAGEEQERVDVEENKMFRRWEWLIAPRA